IQTLTLSTDVIWISIPIAIFIGAILLANNIRDLDNDEQSGRKTIAILLGRKNAIQFLGLMFVIAYGLTAVYIMTNLFPLWCVLTFLSGPEAIHTVTPCKG